MSEILLIKLLLWVQFIISAILWFKLHYTRETIKCQLKINDHVLNVLKRLTCAGEIDDDETSS